MENLQNQIESWRRAKEGTQGFMPDIVPDFDDLNLGLSFNPEHWIFDPEVGIYTPKRGITPLDSLDFSHQELRMTNIRLAPRWSQIEKEDGSLDFSYYRNYFEYCFQNGFESIALNLGPIKGMRWPEEHIPEHLMQLVKPKDHITLDHPLSDFALDYLGKICDFIISEYSNHLHKIKYLQADNEVFNRFGHLGLTFSDEFEQAALRIIMTKFPQAKILINSNAVNDLKRIYRMLEEFDLSRFVIGINYYYKVPIHHRIPIVNKLDGVTLSKPGSISVPEMRRIADTTGHGVEISELQLEPWPPANTPGNDYKEFLMELYRSQFMKPETQPKLVVRLWGVEDFATPFLFDETEFEREKVKLLIQAINSRRES